MTVTELRDALDAILRETGGRNPRAGLRVRVKVREHEAPGLALVEDVRVDRNSLDGVHRVVLELGP